MEARRGTLTAPGVGLNPTPVEIDNADGTITASGLAGAVWPRTDNGAVEAHGLTGDRITARSRDGAITLRFTAPPADVQAGTGNGSIHLRLPAGEGYAINASTGGGGKWIDPALHQDSQAKRHIKLTTGDGGISVTSR